MYATKIERPMETFASSREPHVYATKIERPMETFDFSNDPDTFNNQEKGPRYVDDYKSQSNQNQKYDDVLEPPYEAPGITNASGSGSKFGFEEAEGVKPRQQQKKATNQEAEMKVTNGTVDKKLPEEKKCSKQV